MNEPLAPGTAPLMSTRFCSGSTFTICRLTSFTLSPPMRPAIRIPLNTREGQEEAPMEPGARSLLCWPWVWPPTPENPH